MASKEQIENSIVRDKISIDSIMQPKEGTMVMQHRAIPSMLDLQNNLALYMELSDAEVETCCMMYRFLADSFAYVPFFPYAVECYTKALECAASSDDETVRGEIPELIYNIAKYRNIIARDRLFENTNNPDCEKPDTVYDSCEDIYVCSKLSRSEVQLLVKEAAVTASRSLLASASEHDLKYLSLLYDMNEAIFAQMTGKEGDKDFRRKFWAAKKKYLSEKGIKWECPETLNPQLECN